MKRYAWLIAVLSAALLLSACGKGGSVGVIGGADGPSKIIVTGPGGEAGTIITGDGESISGDSGGDSFPDIDPAEGVPLSDAELDTYTEFLNRPDANGFLLSGYGFPLAADLFEVFYCGAGVDHEADEAERAAYLAFEDQEEIYTDLSVIPASEVNRVLENLTGCSYAEFQEADNALPLPYLPNLDAFFSQTGYPNNVPVRAISGVRYPDGRVTVVSLDITPELYDGADIPADTFTTTLMEREGADPQFLSNFISGGWRAEMEENLRSMDAPTELSLSPPPFARTEPADSAEDDTLPVTLELLEKKDNNISWITDWVRDYWDEWMQDPAFAAAQNPQKSQMNELAEIADQDWYYTYEITGGTFLQITDREMGIPVLEADFTAYLYPEGRSVFEGEVLDGLDAQEVRWARIVNGMLIVSNFHRTYAESSAYNNAYLTAIDLDSGEVIWRSDPLVCNSSNFEILGVEDGGLIREGVILCGYGFTAEDDYIYQISLDSGKTLDRTPVDNQADCLVYANGKLYAHCYSRDYVFEVFYG